MKKYTINECLNISDIRVLKDVYGYFIAGNLAKPASPDINYPFFCRMNSAGDTIHTKTFNTYFGMIPIHDAMFSHDSSKIWWFSSTSPSMYGRRTRREIDTLFNFIREDTLTWRISSRMNAKSISDTSFLLSCSYLLSGPGQPQDEDIGIFVYNNEVEELDFNHFGAPDTVDYPGQKLGFDFKDPDTIYYVGTKNIIFSFSPEDPSWIMIGQLDNNLQPRYQRFYGGDAYYKAMNIIATRDGGCLINSLVYNPDFNLYDFLIMKLNPEGLITGTKPLIAPLRYAIVRPNPASNLLIVEYTNQHGILSIFDVNGKVVHRK